MEERGRGLSLLLLLLKRTRKFYLSFARCSGYTGTLLSEVKFDFSVVSTLTHVGPLEASSEISGVKHADRQISRLLLSTLCK